MRNSSQRGFEFDTSSYVILPASTGRRWRDDGLPQCSEPDDRWPPQINACLREILRYRRQMIDPEGYRKELQEAADKANQKPIKGSTHGGRKE